MRTQARLCFTLSTSTDAVLLSIKCHAHAFINILTGSFKHCLIINWSSSQDCLSVHCSRFWGKWSQHVKNTKHVLKCSILILQNPLQYSLSQKNRGMITHNKGIDMTQTASKSITYAHHRDKGKNSDIKIMCLTQLGIGDESFILPKSI